MIFVSTGGCSGGVAEILAQLDGAGLAAVELSGGAWAADLREQLAKATIGMTVRLHNYFPPPREPFVLNLGSLDEDIRRRSAEQVRKALHWSAELGSPVYSVHAGFCVDPDCDELGEVMQHRALPRRTVVMERFLQMVHQLASEAGQLGLRLLLENNVATRRNVEVLGGDAFLMTTPDECREVMRQTPENVGMLLDVAHLKVSAATLGYPPGDMFQQCNRWVEAYHLSDNDGLIDANEPVQEDSWFWPYLRRDLDYFSLEVYGATPAQLASQVQLVERRLARFE